MTKSAKITGVIFVFTIGGVVGFFACLWIVGNALVDAVPIDDMFRGSSLAFAKLGAWLLGAASAFVLLFDMACRDWRVALVVIAAILAVIRRPAP